MDAQEIFCNQSDLTIAANKKVITTYCEGHGSGVRVNNLYKVKIFVKRVVNSCNFYRHSFFPLSLSPARRTDGMIAKGEGREEEGLLAQGKRGTLRS
jgi:hypothetical protein